MPQNSVRDPRSERLSKQYDCTLQSSDYYSDWTAVFLGPGALVMAASTFVYFQALVGAAKEVHYPAVGFFHNKHNVCMRQRKANSHFGQMRLPFGRSEHPYDVGHKQVIYHDIYSRQFFLTYDEMAAGFAALSCDSVLRQHVCDDTDKPDNFRESRYCYYRRSPETESAAATAVRDAIAAGKRAVARVRASGLSF